MSESGTVDEHPVEPARVTGAAQYLQTMRVEAEYRHETRNLNRQERDKYSNFLWNMMRMDLGPRATIDQLVGVEKDGRLGFREEQGLNASVNYYHRKSNHSELIQVLKFFTAYLMQLVRKEPDIALQQFLLFKAVDFARMIVQYSPLAVNSEAEALVFGVYVALGSDDQERFSHYMQREEQVFTLMRRLQMVPHDVQIRMRLGEALAEQTSYFDALAQYQMLLRILVRRGEQSTRSRGYVLSKMGELFENLAELSVARLGDGRKLKSFIDRFNRDFAERGKELPPFTKPNSAQLNRVKGALLGEAHRWFIRAAATPGLEVRIRVRCATRAGNILNNLGKYKDALSALEDGYGLWRGIRTSLLSLQEQSEYLKHITTAAIHLKRRATLEWATKESAEVIGKISAIDREKKEHEQAKAALLA